MAAAASANGSSGLLAKLGNLWFWHLLVLLLLSAFFESLFLQHRLNLMDEGWPLYSAMRAHGGGVLYDDVFFVFPPGHLIGAWLGYGFAPPGVVGARVFYALFMVLLCPALYVLGRRVMSPSFAFLGAALVAVAAPRSHMSQNLFAYRFLFFSVLSLIAFSTRLETGRYRHSFISGLWSGVALCFRLTPPFAVACGVAVAAVAASRDWRSWVKDWSLFSIGLLLVAAPVTAWFAWDVGLATLWREIVVRAVVMTQEQALPMPDLAWPVSWERGKITEAFIALEFRLYPLLFAVYLAVLGARWLRAFLRRQSFDGVLLLTVTIWGAVYFSRALGRSDEPHLDSAVPPACFLMAHALGVGFRRLWQWRPTPVARQRWIHAAAVLVALGTWIFLLRSDVYRDPGRMGRTPLRAAHERVFLQPREAVIFDEYSRRLREMTGPDETILVMHMWPMYYVLAGRNGPGHLDILIPGTFLDEAEERGFVERLEREPPAAVFWPPEYFDGNPDRSIENIAPLVAAWVQERYEASGFGVYEFLMLPKAAEPDGP